MEDSPDAPARVPPLSDETIRAQKLDAVARLAPGITHELNNPLAAIVGFAELLATDPRLPDDMRRQAGLLGSEAATTQRITQTLLEFLRARPPERHPTSMAPLIDAVLVLHGYRLHSTGIDIVVDGARDAPVVAIDRAAMQLVLVNLVQEAIDAIAGDGGPRRLAIQVAAGADGVRLTIDLGESGSSGSADGDLGWLVSSAIVADHGGSLARSARGVSLLLPTAADARPTAAEERPVALAGGRVLVLDDEPSIRLLLERWLSASGFEPSIATSGQQAVDLAGSTPFDAVLCDHRMAGMTGTEVYDTIVALQPQLRRRFVFMTGDMLNPDLREFVQQRGISLLAKPFDLAAVRRTLDEVLRS